MVRRHVLRVSRPLLLSAVVAWCAALALWLPAVGGAAVPGHGRAWELVTTADTNGVPIQGARAWSADGDQVLIWSYGPLPGASGGELNSHARAARTPQGWTVTPVANRFTSYGIEFFYPALLALSPDLSTSLWASTLPLLPGAPSDPMVGVYRRSPDGTLELLFSGGDRSGNIFLVGATDDLEHAVFGTSNHLLPADAGRLSGSGVYELVGGATLRLVDVDETGAAFPCGATVPVPYLDGGRVHPVSADGRRIFFSAAPACDEPEQVYVRQDGAQTIDLSTSRCTRPDCNAPQSVVFSGATADGAQVLLTTGRQLIDDDTDDTQDLYVRRLSDGALRRISEGPTGRPANVSSPIVRASDDGRRVYFMANGALVPGMGDTGDNLYLSDDGTVRFVASVPGGLNLGLAETTPDGGTLVFTTSLALLPGDLDTNVDVYRYDAVSGALTLASQGDAGRGNASLDADLVAPTLDVFPGQRMRPLSDDGRVFFVTTEALLPDDHNETSDVYEHANGTLGLISSGNSTFTKYLGVSADGRSVFFTTDESLLPIDRDRGDIDVYAARRGGGIPEAEAAPPAPRCTGDACQGAPAARVVPPSPDSLTAEAEVVRPPAPFGLRAPSAQVRRQLAATGKGRLTVGVPAAGRLALVARARTTGARKAVVVGRANATLRRAVTAHLTLRLSRAARRTLKVRGSLTLTLSVRHSRLGPARSLQVKLTRPAARSRTGAAR
jgi:hypothetical protein